MFHIGIDDTDSINSMQHIALFGKSAITPKTKIFPEGFFSKGLFHVGIDDTDSINSMCTTYIAAVLVEELSKFSIVSARLIRLNPNIEWKTRGNASICLSVSWAQDSRSCSASVSSKNEEKIKKIILEKVKEFSVLEDENTNPGVVFYRGEIPGDFNDFYCRCLHEVVTMGEAEELAKKYSAEIHKFKSGRGIIGALAAIGSDLEDRTYEIIAYRKKENWGKERNVDRASVYQMDAKTFPLTFNNVDYAENRILITPHSPCPVFFGIRGENPEILKQAYEMVKSEEKANVVAMYETNQGTDAHLEHVRKISDIKPYSSVILEGTVAREPEIITGGHVIFSVSNSEGSIDCAAYEPTRDFRWTVNKLRIGDAVRVYGGVRADKLTVNLEKIEILKLAKFCEEKNPLCKKCGRRMESAGKKQGFRCRKCKTRGKEKVEEEIKRELEEKIYQVPPGAMRHLSKPPVRF
ncbi:MAG: tRNA(Ile)(2)-agmatinylcytidine synthase [Candidatus Hydrothermarchaeota archaeon]|nr:tRNA(Ile)(2)-agmatinylcytidine synthase [Candidatus Hydrothermarchaeota archaeon]